ncbi:hypothetical protein AAFF_G00056920 [Aldrovandia affinis]|uniref:Uncharacterized protein n=1 Tax=Aldrovandia affinis TaxID=143900 RepID=A0AAD7WE83_9TELE|nr:hypothetical protein AAFF_G00056920 [Aldrovandia affinis]
MPVGRMDGQTATCGAPLLARETTRGGRGGRRHECTHAARTFWPANFNFELDWADVKASAPGEALLRLMNSDVNSIWHRGEKAAGFRYGHFTQDFCGPLTLLDVDLAKPRAD